MLDYPVRKTAIHLAVAGDIYDGVLFLLSIFPRDVLDEIWDRIESVAEIFPIYSYSTPFPISSS